MDTIQASDQTVMFWDHRSKQKREKGPARGEGERGEMGMGNVDQYLLDTIELPDVIQGVQCGREPAMQAEDLQATSPMSCGALLDLGCCCREAQAPCMKFSK